MIRKAKDHTKSSIENTRARSRTCFVARVDDHLVPLEDGVVERDVLQAAEHDDEAERRGSHRGDHPRGEIDDDRRAHDDEGAIVRATFEEEGRIEKADETVIIAHAHKIRHSSCYDRWLLLDVSHNSDVLAVYLDAPRGDIKIGDGI